MSYTVRKHTRKLASGRTATVRQHSREGGGDGSATGRPGFDPEHRAPAVGSAELRSTAPPPRETWWDDGGQAAEGDWWDGEEETTRDCDHAHCTLCGKCLTCDPHPPHSPPLSELGRPQRGPEMSGAFRAMVAQNPSLAEGHKELAALRDAGYDGPVGQDGKPASRVDLFKALLRAEREQDAARDRFGYARTIPERDAAERDYMAAKARFDTLSRAAEAMGGKRPRWLGGR